MPIPTPEEFAKSIEGQPAAARHARATKAAIDAIALLQDVPDGSDVKDMWIEVTERYSGVHLSPGLFLFPDLSALSITPNSVKIIIGPLFSHDEEGEPEERTLADMEVMGRA